MPPLLGVSLNYLLIDVSLALTALVVGFYAALWWFRHTNDSAVKAVGKVEASVVEEKANELERANMAAQQLRDLAKKVATDVGEHTTLVSDISEQLVSAEEEGLDPGIAVLEAMSQIQAANGKLTERLADAEQKIQIQAEEILTQQSEARTDALTKLANRRAFDDAVEMNLAEFAKKPRPFCLLLFDVDHFKQFNDTHGHLAGDEVLRRVGKTLKQVVKHSDLPCRYGGEEFALIMPSTRIKQGRIAAERVRNAIEAMIVEFEGKRLQVTASIGLTEIRADDDATQLIRRADDAVYKGKKSGRNCGHWNDGQECLPMDVESSSPEPQEGDTSGTSNSADGESSLGLKVPKNHLDALPDKSMFMDELQRRISESHRFGVDLAVMHLHVQGYEALELEYGDAVGRLILDSVAQFVRNTLRDMDLLSKLDSGEFIVMLPGSSEDEARIVGNRVQTAISNCTIPLGDKQLRLEVQSGVTRVQADDDALSVMDRARELVSPDTTGVPSS